MPPRQRQVLALTIDGWTPAERGVLLEIDSSAASTVEPEEGTPHR